MIMILIGIMIIVVEDSHLVIDSKSLSKLK